MGDPAARHATQARGEARVMIGAGLLRAVARTAEGA